MPYLAPEFASRAEAEIAAAVLSEEGIETWVAASDAGGSVPSMQAVGGVRVRVSDDDYERAAALLNELGLAARRDLPPLSSRDRLQSWLVGLLLLFVLLWMVWTFTRGALSRPSEPRPALPPQHAQPF